MEPTGNCPGAPGGLVCVTGGSGFIGSWLVRLLLDRGYAVRATVKNIQDERETKHLEALDAAASRLRLLQMDLLDPASVRAAVEGARGVFHLASPVTLQLPQNPEKELLEPAVKGTLNILRAAKDSGISRVVLMSSKAAMVPNPDWPADKVIDDDSWADVELLSILGKRRVGFGSGQGQVTGRIGRSAPDPYLLPGRVRLARAPCVGVSGRVFFGLGRVFWPLGRVFRVGSGFGSKITARARPVDCCGSKNTARAHPPRSSGRVGSGFFRAGWVGLFGSGDPCPGLC